MTSQPPETNLQSIWQNQETEKSTMSVEEVRLKAQKVLFRHRRDVIVRAAFGIAAAVFCGIVFMNSVWQRAFGFQITPLAVIAGLVMAMLVVNTIRNVYFSFVRSKSPIYGAFHNCLDFYRRELERQQAAAAQPMWQLVTALLIISWLTRSALVRFSANSAILLFVLLAGGGLILLLAIRKFQARGVQEEIDALERFENDIH